MALDWHWNEMKKLRDLINIAVNHKNHLILVFKIKYFQALMTKMMIS